MQSRLLVWRWRAGRSSLLMAVAALAACSSTSPGTSPSRPPPGVVFAFPYKGQLDVPVDARVTVAMSQALAVGNVQAGCAGGGAASGAICVQDEDGTPVAGTAAMVGAGGAAIQFVPDQPLAPGRHYQVFVDPALIQPAASNIAIDKPVVTFVTRDERIRPGEAAHVVAVDDEDPAVFAPGSMQAPRYPLVEFATLRLLMSEPIASASAVLGKTVQFVRVDDGGGETPVPATLFVAGIHIVVDPGDDLEPGRLYRLRLTSGLLDQGGEAAQPTELDFRPTSSRKSGDLYEQRMAVFPGLGDSNYPAAAAYSPVAENSSVVRSILLGEDKLQIRSGTLLAEMAHPDDFTTIVPVVARKGQRLAGDSIDVALGGNIPTGVSTGDVELRFLTDMTGVLRRNSFRDDSVVPDNDRAPIEVRFSFDLAMSAADPSAGGALDQTLLGVQAAGVAKVENGGLELSNVAFMELHLLNKGRASVESSLNFRVEPGAALAPDRDPPTLLGTVPAANGVLLSTTDGILLRFSEPVAVGRAGAVTLVDRNGNAVAASVSVDGAIVTVTPDAPLTPGARYDVVLGGDLTDVAGNPWLPSASDPTAGGGKLPVYAPPLPTVSTRAPPVATAVLPGAPCALSNGACTGGKSGDASYLPFKLPANLPIEVFFDQPMEADSLALGSSCGSGAVRVEEVSGGSCVQPVPGDLVRRDRGLVFVPKTPWKPGASYRLVLHGGSDANCSAGELCGKNGLAFNSDPLNGAGAGGAGGPDMVVDFVGAADTSDTVVAVSALPRVDANGNGRVDNGEPAGKSNVAVASITDTSGVVTSASFANDCDPSTPGNQGCMYLNSDLVSKIGAPKDNCSIATTSGTITAPHCIPIQLEPPIIYGTSLKLNANVLGIGLINNLETGMMILRVRDDQGPVMAYIIEGSGGTSEVITTLHTYMDAPDLTLLGGLSSHDLHSKPLNVTLRGPLKFRKDGRIVMSLANTSDVVIKVGVSTFGASLGSMTLTIPAGRMGVELMSRSPHGGEL